MYLGTHNFHATACGTWCGDGKKSGNTSSSYDDRFVAVVIHAWPKVGMELNGDCNCSTFGASALEALMVSATCVPLSACSCIAASIGVQAWSKAAMNRALPCAILRLGNGLAGLHASSGE